MKILLHKEHKIQRIPFPRGKKRPNGRMRRREDSRRAGAVELLRLAGHGGGDRSRIRVLGFRLRDGAVDYGRGKTRPSDLSGVGDLAALAVVCSDVG